MASCHWPTPEPEDLRGHFEDALVVTLKQDRPDLLAELIDRLRDATRPTLTEKPRG